MIGRRWNDLPGRRVYDTPERKRAMLKAAALVAVLLVLSVAFGVVAAYRLGRESAPKVAPALPPAPVIIIDKGGR